MSRILDKTRYPLDTEVSKDDYVVGTDVDDGLKTKNFNIGSIIRLFNSEVNFSAAEFRFSDGEDPDITYSSQGFFFSNSPTGAAADTSKIFINDKTIGGTDLSDLFVLLGSNPFSFSIKLINSSDPADSLYFKVTTVVAHADYFEINVEVIGQNYQRGFVDLTTYNVYLEVIGDQDNKNLVKNVVVSGLITDTKVVAAINALPQFTVADDQSVIYSVTSDNGQSSTFLPVGKGKGVYGAGGTQLAEADVIQINSFGSGSSTAQIVSANITGEYTEAKAITAINSLPAFELSGIPYFYLTSDTGVKYIVAGIGLSAGTYGTGGTQIGGSNVELISVIGLSNDNLIKELSIEGDPTGEVVSGAINASAQFSVEDNQTAFFVVTPTGSTTSYTFIVKGKQAGTYGVGGRVLTEADLELISVQSGGTSWKLQVGGVDKKTVKVGDSVDIRQAKYAVVQYTEGGYVEISTSQELDDLLASFKPTVVLSKTQFDTLKASGQLASGTIYAKYCDI